MVFPCCDFVYNVKFQQKIKSSLNGFNTAYEIVQRTGREVKSVELFLELAKEDLIRFIQKGVRKHGGVKVLLAVHVRYQKESLRADRKNGGFKLQYTDDKDQKNPYHRATMEIFTSQDRNKIIDYIDKCAVALIAKIEEFQDNGSDWVVNKIPELYLNITGWQPLKASSYISLPKCYGAKKAIINVKNKDKSALSGLF